MPRDPHTLHPLDPHTPTHPPARPAGHPTFHPSTPIYLGTSGMFFRPPPILKAFGRVAPHVYPTKEVRHPDGTTEHSEEQTRTIEG